MENLVNVVIPPLADAYTYLVPSAFQKTVDIGYQVEVSLGRRQASGFVVARYSEKLNKEKFPYQLKSLLEEARPVRSFNPAQLEFFRWVADYYGESLASVIDVAVPTPAQPTIKRTITLIDGDIKKVRGAREREILSALQENPPPTFETLQRRFKNALPTLYRLEEKGFLKLLSEEVVELPFAGQPSAEWAKRHVTLNPVQKSATSEIEAAMRERAFKPFLLHGVTGSGKTEVYLEAIRATLDAGLGALIVVPEIALTPQLIDRFRARLGDELAVLHSALSRKQRWNSWRALLEGKAHVAVGARSGIFAPVNNLGLIVVDEEHDSSYKQSEGLRYNARDLALVLGKMRSCPVVLGSATPALESFYHAAETKKYRYISLPGRHGATMSDIELVDMNRAKPWTMASKHISPQLGNALGSVLERREQAFILYNRRGFAAFLQCDECGAVIECENCSVTMTYHRADNSLLCHYCGLSMVVPSYCPECSATREKDGEKSGTLVERGAGTEQIFEEVKSIFPTARVERLDRDAASDHDTYRAILDRLRAHEIDILVGTQMIAKGHDLPNVTLVGIADCDVGLHLPDFRASERVFQLLTQASGRAGRGEKAGQVILQTRKPGHPSLVLTQQRDYEKFAEVELGNRKALGYPPYTRLLRIVASSQEKDLPLRLLTVFREGLLNLQAKEGTELEVLGPAAAPIRKIKTLWRAHLLVKSKSVAAIHRALAELLPSKARTNKVRVTFDVDPQDLL